MEGNAPAAAAGHADTDRAGGRQGKALTRHLLALARRDARVVSRVCLERAAQSGVNTLARVLPPRVKLTFEQHHSAHVDADETELHQLLSNLVLNARDAMPDGGSIAVTSDVVTVGTPLVAVGGKIAAGRWQSSP